jgi:hypothetical protein
MILGIHLRKKGYIKLLWALIALASGLLIGGIVLMA